VSLRVLPGRQQQTAKLCTGAQAVTCCNLVQQCLFIHGNLRTARNHMHRNVWSARRRRGHTYKMPAAAYTTVLQHDACKGAPTTQGSCLQKRKNHRTTRPDPCHVSFYESLITTLLHQAATRACDVHLTSRQACRWLPGQEHRPYDVAT
jgi:3D (Asp-Asp-Asp) domain-containing protein